jgi:uncharacterized protein with HEPN domain
MTRLHALALIVALSALGAGQPQPPTEPLLRAEAARRVSSDVREAHPEIPWADIVGMRSKIVHDYMNVDEDILWEVVTRDLPALVSAVEKLMHGEL